MALATPDIGAPGPSSSSTSPINYHVFLSSCARHSFADHLYHALRREGIITFRRDEHHERRELISNQTLQAIQQSQLFIVVLSENYASSSRRLEELLGIIESKKQNQGQAVVSVFYDIDPSDVRHQKGSIAAAFDKHEARFSVDRVRRWREALTDITDFSGWDDNNRHESGLIENIVKSVRMDLYGYDYPPVRGPNLARFLEAVESKVFPNSSRKGIGTCIRGYGFKSQLDNKKQPFYDIETLPMMKRDMRDTIKGDMWRLTKIQRDEVAMADRDTWPAVGICDDYQGEICGDSWHEAEIAEDSTQFEGNRSGDEMPPNFPHLVGDIQSKVDGIISLLKMELNDTCFIGIWGESGIGKTTLARLVYDEIQSKFDATCFLDNVREDSERVGIVSLQKKLLSEFGLGDQRDIDVFSEGAMIIRKFLGLKKVLIILDDVSERSQLENLAGNKEWFGVGSKILITTTDKTLLTLYEQFEEYEVGRLHYDESLKLLCLEAFNKNEPEEGYLDLSKEVIEYSRGLPLVLKVLGSFLCKKDQNEWRNTSERLRQNSATNISGPLRISYNGLEDEEYKKIFLDIACFFNWDPKSKVKNILELCDPHSTSGIEVLIEKSMLNVIHSNSDLWQNAKEDQGMLDRIQSMRKDYFLPTHLYDWLLQEASKVYLHMHDLLQEMGRDIVFQESPTNAGGRNRLWSLEDIDLVLKENKVTKHVQSIVLKAQQGFKADWDPNCFSKAINLRLLDLSNVHLSKKLESLPTALKFLRWDDYSEDCMPAVEKLCDLESLQLCNSKIRTLWEGNPAFNKLKMIEMSGSEYLSETPDFSGTPNLEELLLNRCRKLVQVHESVGQLKKLVKLSLKKCRRLELLPSKLETNNLHEFILMGCIVLEKLPEFGRNMESLYFLDVMGTDITEIPQSIIHLTNLKCLDLTLCSRLKSIPELPPNLIISASNCSLLEPTYALRHLYASCAPKGPIHLFYDFQLLTRIPTWFERWEYCWGKDTSGEFVTITADIPSNVVGDSNNEERWGIAVSVVFQFLSQAWQGFSVDWKFKADNCHPKKTKINGTPVHYMHDCRVYVGFYPFEAKDCRQHASGEGSQLDLTLVFPAANIVNGLYDLKIMGCGWRLACKKDFDEQSESRSPSPPRLGCFLDRNMRPESM